MLLNYKRGTDYISDGGVFPAYRQAGSPPQTTKTAVPRSKFCFTAGVRTISSILDFQFMVIPKKRQLI